MVNIIPHEKFNSAEYASIDRCRQYFMKTIGNHLQGCNGWVAGGAIRAFFSPDEKISDIDLFFPSAKDAATAVRLLRKIGFKHFFINKNAIKGSIEKNGKKILIDIVKRYYPSPVECIEDFDFSVCKFAFHLNSMEFYHGTSSFVDLLQKKLVIPDENFGNPIGSLKRLQKYSKKGYFACNGTLLSIAKRINQTDLSNPEQNDIEFYPDGKTKIRFFD